VGLSRSVQRYRPIERDDGAVVARLRRLASENRRYGDLRLHALLRREGLVVNAKRTWRRHRGEGLQVPDQEALPCCRAGIGSRHSCRAGPCSSSRVLLTRVPSGSDDPPAGGSWSLDFMSDPLADHRRFRILNIVDEHSRFCPRPIVDVSISGGRLARYLDEFAERHGLPQEIVLDNRAPAGRAIRP
jgi:putative transposase